jgi:hypothetical protein
MSVVKVCINCGSDYEVRERDAETSRFCSMACRSAPTNKTCPMCKKTFQTQRSDKKRFCSSACGYRARIKHKPKVYRCVGCGQEFLARRTPKVKRVYCSRQCYKPSRAVRRNCDTCGTSFKSCNQARKHCSKKCLTQSQLVEKQCVRCGRTFSIAQSLGNRLTCSARCAATVRIERNCLQCGKSFLVSIHDKGKSRQRFCSKPCALKALTARRGSAHPSWKGGLTGIRERVRQTGEYVRWRQAVLTRDARKCQHCGSRKYLHVHHIKFLATHPELMFDVSNGLTLCAECHTALHREIGEPTDSNRLVRYLLAAGWDLGERGLKYQR